MDNFREWLSDNLRYFMLGGAILVVVAVMFFGIRACVGSRKGDSDKDQTQQVEVDNNQGNVPSSPEDEGETNDGKKEEDTNSLEKGSEEITAVMQKYYKALEERDIATLETLVDDLSPSDEPKIINAKDYIEAYEVVDVYTKKGMEENTYVVYVEFNYICKGITTPVPALSWSYVVEDAQGNFYIDGSAIQDAQINAYVDSLQADEDVAKLTSDIQAAYEKAQADDADLAAFLAGLGEDASSAAVVETGTKLTVTEDCNVRDSAGGEIIGGLPAGTEVEKQGEDGEWIQIEYEGGVGYIHNSLLE